jgi:hypothetical protein
MSLSNEKNVIKSFIEEAFNQYDISAAEKYFPKENPSIGMGILNSGHSRVAYQSNILQHKL